MPSCADVIRWVKPDIEFHQHGYARGLAEAVPANCRWLDVGAGTKIHDGWLSPTETEFAAKARLLIGCDVVTEHLARNRLLTAAVSADAGALPFLRRPWIGTLVEALWIRVIGHRSLERFRTDLFGEMEKTATSTAELASGGRRGLA